VPVTGVEEETSDSFNVVPAVEMKRKRASRITGAANDFMFALG